MMFTIILGFGEEAQEREIEGATRALKVALNYEMEKRLHRIRCPDGRKLTYSEFAAAVKAGEFGDA